LPQELTNIQAPDYFNHFTDGLTETHHHRPGDDTVAYGIFLDFRQPGESVNVYII
jgi:hypothetical protein